ncbi:4a494968-872a-42f7-b7e8-1d72ebf10730, partial [Thermothielavioides terrestris]
EFPRALTGPRQGHLAIYLANQIARTAHSSHHGHLTPDPHRPQYLSSSQGVTIVECPPHSPNLNAIEHVWFCLDEALTRSRKLISIEV